MPGIRAGLVDIFGKRKEKLKEVLVKKKMPRASYLKSKGALRLENLRWSAVPPTA
ncbi:MAG: hypothetical protein QME47_03635 [Candidatus Thermoplasmatota archaeon]|nr:hypothetical protein [Candidatus Thermoplasmatota archaeon]